MFLVSYCAVYRNNFWTFFSTKHIRGTKTVDRGDWGKCADSWDNLEQAFFPKVLISTYFSCLLVYPLSQKWDWGFTVFREPERVLQMYVDLCGSLKNILESMAISPHMKCRFSHSPMTELPPSPRWQSELRDCFSYAQCQLFCQIFMKWPFTCFFKYFPNSLKNSSIYITTQRRLLRTWAWEEASVW